MKVDSKKRVVKVGRRYQPAAGRGFTLIELVVTLVIIGALAAISAPLFSNVQGFRQSGFYNETLASVRYAQKLAVASGCAVQVTTTATSLNLFQSATAATCTTGPYATSVGDPSNAGNPFTRSPPSGIALTAATFVFCPLGNVAAVAGACPSSSSSSANIVVTVGGSQNITVVRDTGHVCNATAVC